jgi:hypothetical protein
MSAGVAASYRVGVLGYALGMAISALGDVPTGLLFLGATSLGAITLFVASGVRLP